MAKHPYPREINEYDEYSQITCHFLAGKDICDMEKGNDFMHFSVRHCVLLHSYFTI